MVGNNRNVSRYVVQNSFPESIGNEFLRLKNNYNFTKTKYILFIFVDYIKKQFYVSNVLIFLLFF